MSKKRSLLTPEQLEARRRWDRDYHAKNKATRNAQRRRWASTRRSALAERQRAYYQNNVGHYRDYVTSKNKEKRRIVLEHYSNGTMKCACCGETIEEFLTIDHIYQDGAQHRREIAGNYKGRCGGNKTYEWLIKNNFPEGFRVLCMNCNMGSYKNKGICPHKKEVV